MRSTLDLGRVVRAVRYSYAGLEDAVRNHTAFRQELLIGAAMPVRETGIPRGGIPHGY